MRFKSFLLHSHYHEKDKYYITEKVLMEEMDYLSHYHFYRKLLFKGNVTGLTIPTQNPLGGSSKSLFFMLLMFTGIRLIL